MRVVIAGVGRSGSLMRTQLDVEDGRDVVSVPYAMPVEPLCVGAFIGHRFLGTTVQYDIGCVTRVRDGEFWVVPDSAAPRDPGVQRLRRRTAMNGERVWLGGGSAGMELVQGEWRRLNTGSPDDDEQAAKLWVQREMQWELSVVVTSTAAHCDCRTRVRQARSRTLCPDVPDNDTERLRAELEGIGIGLEDVEQQAARFQRLAADPCV
jgi:hypothetical protein